MEKNSTLFYNRFFISLSKKNVKAQALHGHEFNPCDEVINNILNFSKALEIFRMDSFLGEKSHGIGLIEVVLN